MSGAALYHRALVELARDTRFAGRLQEPTRTITLDNPLCGDRVTLDVTIAGDRLTACRHKVRGCLLCQASAAMLAAHGVGVPTAELHAQADAIAAWLARADDAGADAGAATAAIGQDVQGQDVHVRLPELETFAPVRPFRSRHRCVLLPFEALQRLLDEDSATAPTDQSARA